MFLNAFQSNAFRKISEIFGFFDPWRPQFGAEPKNCVNSFEMLFDELSNVFFSVFRYDARKPS